MIKFGFTGTREGMSRSQKRALMYVLSENVRFGRGDEFHHGSCVGCDKQAHEIAKEIGMNIIVHPPINKYMMAICQTEESNIREPKHYLERNKQIVTETDALIACPKSNTEELRSGTWSTIRFAKSLGKKIVIIYQDGGVEKIR